MTVEDSYLCGYLKIKGLTEVSFESRSNVAKLTFILSDTKHKLVRAFSPVQASRNWFLLAQFRLNCDKD